MKIDKAIFNWSSGKDSAMALHMIMQWKTFDIHCLLTSINSQYDRISMHGVRISLLEKQAESIGLPLHTLLIPEMPSMEIYDNVVGNAMKEFKAQGIDYSIFGDIFLEDLRKYREDQ